MALLNFLQGVGRQANPFDNGATFKNPQGNGQKRSTLSQAKDAAVGVGKSLVEAPMYFLNTDIINPAKSVAAQVTGNEEAYRNAEAAENKLATPRKLAGNTANLALTFLAPGIAKGVGGAVEKKVGSEVAQKLLTGAITGAATGAPFSAAATVAGDEPLTAKGLAKSAAQGAVIGAGLGVVGEGVGLAAKNRKPLNEVGSINNVADDELQRLSKATDVSEVKAVLKDRVSPQTAERIAPAIAQATDRNAITNILENQVRPYDAIQTRIEAAHNVGDNATVQKLLQEIPESDRAGIDPTASSHAGMKAVVDPETHKISLVPVEEAPTPSLQEATVPSIKEQPAIPQVETDPFNEIMGAVTGSGDNAGIEAARARQNELLSQERGQRFANVGKSGESEFGEQGYLNRRAALKGEYSKVDYKPLVSDIGPERTNELFTGAQKKIYSTPDEVYTKNFKDYGLDHSLAPDAAKFNTEVAVRKVLGLEPGLPTSSEIKLLRVQSPELAQIAEENIPKQRKLFDYAAKISGTSRALKSTGDLSMGGRQGITVAARHPVLWAEANIDSVKFAKNPEYYTDTMQAIADDPWIKAAGKRDLGLTGITGHEEAFPRADLLDSTLARKTGVKTITDAAERAYTGGLTRLRGSLWKSRLQAYGDTPEAAAQALGEKGLNGLAEVIRTETGRGGKAGGWVEKHATTLNESLFSPRLWASRLEPLNPAYWKRIGPAGRAEAIQSLGSFAAVAGTVLTAAHQMGAQVETDPRSSDFLKIKVGDKRYDILGGYQQNLVFLARQLSNSTKSSSTGKITKYGDKFGGPTRLSAAFDLVRNKANPIVAAGANLLEGKDKAGNKINPLTEIGQLFVPIGLQSSFDTARSAGSYGQAAKDVAANAPDFFGFSTQQYGVKDVTLSDKQKAYVKSLKDSGKSDAEVEANTRFFQTLKSVPSRQNASDKINERLAKGDVAGAQKIAQEYNKAYVSTFKQWAQQYGDYSNKTLNKEYNSGKIKLTASSIKARVKAQKNPL